MAERTPKALASYEAAHTTERLPRQATMTGLPRSCGSSRCSTEAQNASASTWMIFRIMNSKNIFRALSIQEPRRALYLSCHQSLTKADKTQY
jgi:hypothetical protein